MEAPVCVPDAWVTSDFVYARTLRIYRGAALALAAAIWVLALVEHAAAWITTQASYWALALGTVYFAAALAARPGATPRVTRSAAALLHVAVAGATATTLLFWTFVFPGAPRLAATTIPLHGGLALALAADLVLSRLPYVVTDVVWTLLFALAYVLAALVWWAAGRAADTPFYAFLDFDKPGTLWLVVALGALTMLADVAVLAVHAAGRALATRAAQCFARPGGAAAAAYHPLHV